ncbi:MAG: D-alanyl-D-alanine carboxypeptidase/D-alanyl-D-alanine-endopeptidase [Planctomycetota bacterium]
MIFSFIVIGVFVLVWCQWSANGQDIVNGELGEKIDAALSTKHLAKAFVGVKIVCLTDGTTVYSKNASKLFSVASNMKVATTAASLALLGKSYEFKTKLLRSGTIEGKTLNGDLVVIGEGDPNISNRFYSSPNQVFQTWAKILIAQGIEKVEGNVVIDDTFFDRNYVPNTWPKGQLHLWYCAPVSAVSLNDNCVDVTVSPGSANSKPAIYTLSPMTNYVKIVNSCVTTSKKSDHVVSLYRGQGSTEITLSGKFFSNSSSQTYYVTVDNPSLFFGTVLKETLESNGVTVEGKVKLTESSVAENLLTPVAVHSQPLQTVISVTNKNSQNLYAEILLKTIGRRVAGSGSLSGGAKAMEKFFNQIGVDKSRFEIADGCGLSREAKITPEALNRIFIYMHKQNYREEFRQSLSLSGYDGTLKNRFDEPNYRGRVAGKTGYIRGVSALSGYASSSSGKLFAFTIIFNKAEHMSNTYMKDIQDKVVKILLSE